MTSPNDPTSGTRGASRRVRRGHRAQAEQEATSRPAAKPRKLDPKLFREVDEILAAWLRQRVNPLLQPVAQAFFGSATAQERRDSDLGTAMMLFFVYGWRDPAGLRIIDMFAREAIVPTPAHRGVLESMRTATYRWPVVTARDEGRQLLVCDDRFTGQRLLVTDRSAWQTCGVGDSLLAWTVPTGEAWRPFGTATIVLADRVDTVDAALRLLAKSTGVGFERLPSLRADQVFWTAFRIVNGAADRPVGPIQAR